MGDKSGIQWTDATWNPVTGCDQVSPGCAHCYAKDVAKRFWAKQYPPIPLERVGDWRDGEPASRDRVFEDVQTHEDRLEQPLLWKRPRMIFVNSMSDLFHETVPVEFIGRVFNVMGNAKQHTFQILTKRPERMRDVLKAYYETVKCAPYENVWIGVSVENQHWADIRVPLLMETPAAIRFVSYEPALGPVDFSKWIDCGYESGGPQGWVSLPSLDWIIIGGESGARARPFDIEWASIVIDAAKGTSTRIFVKQLGSVPVMKESVWRAQNPVPLLTPRNHRKISQEYVPLAFSSSKAANPDEWPLELRLRQWPTVNNF